MDLQQELQFQQEQLANEERAFQQMQVQVLFRRGCVAQVQRLIDIQATEHESKEGEANGSTQSDCPSCD